MARVKFEDGTVINFEGTPTPQDIDEAYSQVKGTKTIAPEETKPKSYEDEVMQKEQERKDRILSGKGNRITKFAVSHPITELLSPAWTGIKSPEDIPDIAAKANPLTLATKPLEFLPQTEKPATQFSKELLYGSIPTPAMAIGAMAPSVIKGASPAFSKAMQIGKDVTTKAGQAISYPLKSGKTIGQVFENIKKPADFAKKLRGKFYQVHANAVNKFGNQIDELSQTNPDRFVSLRDTVDDIVSNLDDMPLEAKSALRRTPKLSKMLNNPELADSVSLRDTQDIINYINTKIPTDIKSKHMDILETLNDVRASQLDAFPEMAQVRADYKVLIEPYKNLKNYFKYNKLLKNIEGNFGGPEGMEDLKKIFPQEVLKEIGGYKNAIGILKAVGLGSLITGGVAGLGFGIGKALSKTGR